MFTILSCVRRLKDGKELDEGGRIRFAQDGNRFTLHIESMQLEDLGAYTVRFSLIFYNAAGRFVFER